MRYTFVLVPTTCGHHVWRSRFHIQRKCLQCGASSEGMPRFGSGNSEETMAVWMFEMLMTR